VAGVVDCCYSACCCLARLWSESPLASAELVPPSSVECKLALQVHGEATSVGFGVGKIRSRDRI
jgi:hypothetical protein